VALILVGGLGEARFVILCACVFGVKREREREWGEKNREEREKE
jgi:ribosomal protein L37E